MADVIMQQSVRILLLSLARACPGVKISINAVGPIHIVNGEVKAQGEPTTTTINLADVKRAELPEPPVALEMLRAEAAAKLAKKVTRVKKRP